MKSRMASLGEVDSQGVRLSGVVERPVLRKVDEGGQRVLDLLQQVCYLCGNSLTAVREVDGAKQKLAQRRRRVAKPAKDGDCQTANATQLEVLELPWRSVLRVLCFLLPVKL